MATQRFLFKDFLADPKVYALNQGFWTKQIRSKFSPLLERENLEETHFANGRKMYDGNPIYSALLKHHKAIRIIQEEPESEHSQISAWVNQTEANGEKIDELVIVLELSDISKSLAMDLISAWLKSERDKKWMENYIVEKLGAN